MVEAAWLPVVPIFKATRVFVDSFSKLLIIVATYNEIDNLPRLVHQVDELLPHADILVIDDASPDGTGNWCEQATSKYPQLTTHHREGKLGLGSAARDGFEIAKSGDYELIATMDADLSHEPKSLLEMVKKMEAAEFQKVGVMIGSRYVEGGGTEGWPFIRRLASKTVNGFSRLMLGLKTRDNSGAFRIYRSTALSKISIESLRSNDLAYLEEILWRLRRAGETFAEHPIIFKNRELGRSKTSTFIGMKIFWQVARMGLGLWK